MASEIDWKQIDQYCAINKRPTMCEVSDEVWRDALLSIREVSSEMDYEEAANAGTPMCTDTVWSMIWFGAVQFCKGITFEQIQSGKRTPSHYPRH